MSQNFTVIPNEALSTSRGRINDNLDSLKTNFSGTGFPASPSVGQQCYRTDEGKLYQWSGSAWAVVGNGDMQKSVYDTNNNGIVDKAEVVEWSGVLNKPEIKTEATNVAVGLNSLLVVQGNSNTAIGYDVLRKLSSGTYNFAAGRGVAPNLTTGSFNVIVGYGSLNSLATGSSNVAIGYDTLAYATGSNNVAIGRNAGGSGDITNSIAVGFGATGNSSNTATIGNTAITALYAGQNGQAVVKCGSPVADGDAATKKYVDDNARVVTGTFNLTSSGWSSGSRTLTSSNLGFTFTATDLITMLPTATTTAEQYDMIAKAKIISISQANNSITLKCLGDVPTANITVTFVKQGGV